MPLIAVDGCTIQDVVGNGTITVIPAGMSKFTKVCDKAVCLDGLQVMVAGGSIPPLTQSAPATITINAMNIVGTKFEGKAPLAVNDMGMGTATYQAPNGATSSVPITVQIMDAGQTAVQAT